MNIIKVLINNLDKKATECVDKKTKKCPFFKIRPRMFI